MAATGSVENAFTFVKGLVTEGGFFLHPKDAWKEGFNVTPNIDGSIERRNGFDYEPNYTLYDTLIPDGGLGTWAYAVEKWENVAGDGVLNFFVVQVGSIINFYEASSGTTSAKKKSFVINLTDFGFVGKEGLQGTSPIKAVSAYGKLIITNRDSEPILVIYNKATDTITAQKIEILIRDFDGIRSPVPPTIEYSESQWAAQSFWPHALYNLYNQGWKDAEISKYKTAKGGLYPANSKQWIYGKNTTDDFDVNVLDKQDFGSMVAPKGRIILKAFYQDRASSLWSVSGTNTGTVGSVGSTLPANAGFDDNYKLPDFTEVIP